MKVYLNYCQHPFVLSHEALEFMGRPRYVTFFEDVENRSIVIVPMKSYRSDLAMRRISEAVYQDGGAYAVETTWDYLYMIRNMAGINERVLCSVEAKPYFIDDLKAGQCGLKKGIKVKGPCLLLDLSEARLDFMEEYPVYTYGGYMICAG